MSLNDIIPKKKPEENTISTKIFDAMHEYLDNGISVIPVYGKKALIPWKNYQTGLPTHDDIDVWEKKYPYANVAIILGSVSNMWAIDADDENSVLWAEQHCKKTSMVSRTGKGSHFLYRMPDKPISINHAYKPSEGVKLEILAEGSYIVAPPSKHAAGREYAWETQLGLGTWEDLEPYHPDEMQAEKKPDQPAKKQGNLELIDFSKIKGIPNKEGEEQGNRNNALAQLAGRWIAKGLDFEDVLVLAKDWNRKNSPPLGEKELKFTVKSILKKENSKQENEKESEKEHLQFYEKTAETESQNEFPKNLLLNAGELLNDITEYIDQASAVSIPQFNLMASICALGSILGQKIMSPTGLRTNLYSINLAYSGSGKDAPLGTLRNLLEKTDASYILGQTELTSETSILKRLAASGQEVCHIMVDEFGYVMAGIKKPLSIMGKIPGTLNMLYSATDRSSKKTYASEDANFDIKWHHLSFYATSTPKKFWDNITSSELADGFLARCLILDTRQEAEKPKAKVKLEIPEKLIKKINHVAGIPWRWSAPLGNIARVTNKKPVPYVISLTAEAQDYFKAWADKYHNLKNERREAEDGESAIYARAAENAFKIMMIRAASDYSRDIIKNPVNIDHVKFATELIDYIIFNTIKQIKDNISDDDFEKLYKQVIKIIKTQSTKEKPGVSFSDIYRTLRKPRTLIESVIECLIISERVYIDHQWETQKGRKIKGGLVRLIK